ncbi:hypothetical protein FOL47_004973 [Perkinsus chesapeaki]|uniref:Charged multivesicular body protein 3 n=1 Tax=Perkinsus chesapeaki TaxID=330153 RepID=A0A7J6MYU0_PERCH|nr:hypothetical protein FOL47_004973 [Perkinsus chesapeaki]
MDSSSSSSRAAAAVKGGDNSPVPRSPLSSASVIRVSGDQTVASDKEDVSDCVVNSDLSIVEENVKSEKEMRKRFWWECFKCCAYIFLLEFKVPEPHLPVYLNQVKGFTMDQINNEIFPVWTYSALVIIFASGFIAEFLGYRAVLILGGVGRVCTRFILMFGTTVLQMQFCQAFYACGSASEVVFFGYIFRVVRRSEYQSIASYTLAAQVLAYALSGILGDLMLSQWGTDYMDLLVLSVVCLAGSVIVACFLTPVSRPRAPRPKDVAKTLKFSYGNKHYLIIIIWWIGASSCYGILYGYETSLYAIIADRDHVPNYNGTVVAISQLIGSGAALIAGLPKIALFMEHHAHLTIAVFGWISLVGVTIMAWWDSIIPMCVSFLFYFGTYYYANALVQAENGRVVKDVTLSHGGDSSYAMLCMINNVLSYGIQAIISAIGLSALQLPLLFMYKVLWGILAVFTIGFTIAASIYALYNRGMFTLHSKSPVDSVMRTATTTGLSQMKFNFFGTRTTKPQQQALSKEQARAWQRSLRSEMRKIDRECGKMEREEKKVEVEIKALARKKEMSSVRILAKEIIRTRKTRERMLTAKAQMNSVSMQLQQAAMTMKMGEAVAGSTQIMQAMSSLIKLPELTETMEGMAKEMENLGIIDGVMSDTLDAIDDVDINEATDQEVNKVLEELAVDTIANVPSATQGALPSGQKVPAGKGGKLSAQQAREEAELERRLNAL